MERENVILIDNKKIIAKVFYLSIFVAIAVVAPYFQNQLITGSIVNALLFISVIIMGVESAIVLCLVPSLISLFTGLLPFALAPVIPFIIMGNMILVFVFNKFRNPSTLFGASNFWTASILSAFLKFIFIWSVGMILANSVLQGISKPIMIMISWPQFATALAGACIAYLFLKIIKR